MIDQREDLNRSKFVSVFSVLTEQIRQGESGKIIIAGKRTVLSKESRG